MQLAVSEIWIVLVFCVMAFLFKDELRRKGVARALLAACVIRLLSDAASWLLDGVPGALPGFVARLSNYVTFVSSDVIAVVFSVFVWGKARAKGERPGPVLWAFWALEAATVVALTLNLRFGWFYAVGADNVYARGKLYALTYVAPAASLLVVVWLLLRYRARLAESQKALGWAYVVLMAGADAYECTNFGLSLVAHAQAFSAFVVFLTGEVELRDRLLATQEGLTRTNEELRGVVRDATEQKRREQEKDRALREQAAIFNALADTYMNVFFIDMDKDVARILKLDGYVIPGLKKDSKEDYPYSTVLDRYVRERVHPDDRDMLRRAISMRAVRGALANSDEYVGTYRVLVDGETHYYQYKFIRMKDIGCVIAGFLNVDQIVERERRQQAELADALAAARQASRAKTVFLSSMSHDIRTPMNAIIGFTALAQAHADDPGKVRDYLAKIGTSSAHLLSLINDILDMSRVESGGVRLEERPVHLPDFLRDLRAMVQGLAASKRQNLRVVSRDVRDEDVMADRLRLNQVLINIVGNAVKFTPAGGDVTVRLAQRPGSAPGRATYEFSVEDNGIGMSAEFVGHVFDTFARERSSTVSGIQGTGLGMAITKALVEMMGGTISVQSEEGSGSTFTVTLPLRLATPGALPAEGDERPGHELAAGAGEGSEGQAPAWPRDYSGKRALLVEDNELNREIALTILGETGMRIDCVADGAEALGAVRSAPPGTYDVVLMDIQMPRMDGYAATKAIRALPDAGRASVPIVAMTADAFEEDRRRAFACGMNGHVVKPFDMGHLARTLDEVFGQA